MPLHREIVTMEGVTAVDQPPGKVEVVLHYDGDTIADLVVSAGTGEPVRVHLDYRMVVQIMTALGAVAEAM